MNLKSNSNIVCIIQARMGSSRLPGKVLKQICGQPMLGWVVKRASRSRLISSIMVATTTNPGDDLIETLCRSEGISCFRGSEFDVLDRYYQAAKSEHADIVVRLTADCPLIEGMPTVIIIDKQGTIKLKEIGFDDSIKEKIDNTINKLLK